MTPPAVHIDVCTDVEWLVDALTEAEEIILV
jgi:hypothetical protein